VKSFKDQTIYCCKYHVELNLLKGGLNSMRDPKKGVHAKLGHQCYCSVCFAFGETTNGICSTHGKVYKGIIQLW
jgi:hypothetical protein